MASTLTIKTTPYGSGRYLQLDCVQTKDIATNTSTIKWTLTSAGGTSNYFSTGPTTVKINGTQVYYIARKDYTTEVFPAAKGSVSGTISIKHDDAGDKTISVSLSTAIYVGTVSTYSKNWELDSIPRKATLTYVPDFTDLDNPTIKYSNLAGTAVTSLKACIALDGSTIVVPYKDVDRTKDSYQFNFTDAERDALRNTVTGPSRTVYVYLRSEIGGVVYYHNASCILTIKESVATKPTITMDVALNNSHLPSKFEGLYIQNKSRVDVTLSASGKYNANINSSYVVIEGTTYKTFPFTSNVIASSSLDVVGYAKDTRGFSNTKTEPLYMIAYSKPLVIPLGNENAIQCYRSDGNGKRIGNSTSLWVKAKRSYYTVDGNNTCALEYRSKLSTEVWNDTMHPWKVLISKTDTATNEYSALIPSAVFDLKKSYTVQIRAIDDFGEYDIKTFDIPTADVALHLGRGGKNVSVGSYCDYSEDYTFHSEWKAIFDDGIHGELRDTIVEDVLDFASKCGKGITPISTNEGTMNIPGKGDFRNASGFVHGSSARVGARTVFLITLDTIAVNFYSGETWSGWHYLYTQQ